MGKDELAFLGITSFIWGLSAPKRRLLALAFGLTLCALVRPHVAAMLAASCAVAVILSSDVPLFWRLLLSTGLLVGLRASFPFLAEFVGIETVDTEASTDFVQRWQGRNLGGGSSVDISEYSLPFQIFTYLYRPLFIDANSALGLVVSVENTILLAITVLCAPWIIASLASGEDRFYSRFNFLFWVMTTAALASTTTNLGIAIRQKIMVLPSLLMSCLRRSRSFSQWLGGFGGSGWIDAWGYGVAEPADNLSANEQVLFPVARRVWRKPSPGP